MKKLIKILTVLLVLFVETICVQAQSTRPPHLKAVLHVEPTSPVKKITDGAQVLFIHEIPENQQVKDGIFTPAVFTSNEVSFILNVKASSFTEKTEETYAMYHAQRIKGYESPMDWFDFTESLKPIKGSQLKGIKWIQNSGVDKDGNIWFGDKKQLDTSWNFLGSYGVPQYKIKGGQGGPCVNLIRIEFIEGWHGEPEKQEPIAQKDMMLEPCSNTNYEMDEWYVENGENLGKFTKNYSNIYWRKRDNTWLQLNGEKWDTICPKPEEKKEVIETKTKTYFSTSTACDGGVYISDNITGAEGEKLFNSQQVMLKNGVWYRKGDDGQYHLMCEYKIAQEERKESHTETTQTEYTFAKKQPNESCECRPTQCGCPVPQTSFWQTLARSFFFNLSIVNVPNHQNYNWQPYRNVGGQQVWSASNPFDGGNPIYSVGNPGQQQFFAGTPIDGGGTINGVHEKVGG